MIRVKVIIMLTLSQEGSCCTAIVEKFAAYSPELLTSKSFSKLLVF